MNGFRAWEAPPLFMNSSTCAFVAAEQLPEIMALRPPARGSSLDLGEGVNPHWDGKAMPSPELAVTSGGAECRAPANLFRSSLLIASAMAIETASERSLSIRWSDRTCGWCHSAIVNQAHLSAAIGS